MRHVLLIALVLGCALWSLTGGGAAPEAGAPPVATFSIVAIDPETGDLGVAVQSKFFGVGAVVPWARADVGAIATQAFANTTYGPRGLALLDDGVPAEEVVKRLTAADRGSKRRQLGLVSASGKAAAFTGERCMDWAGHVVGDGYCCQGNILAGERVVKAMAKAFEKSEGELPERLVAALAAGQKAGGDKRGKQSAALLVVRRAGGYAHFNDRWVDIHVEDHPTPIVELGRLLALWRTVIPPARIPEPIDGLTRDPREFARTGATPRAVFTALQRTARREGAVLSTADRALAGGTYVGTTVEGVKATVFVQLPGERSVRRVPMIHAKGGWTRAK